MILTAYFELFTFLLACCCVEFSFVLIVEFLILEDSIQYVDFRIDIYHLLQ